MSRFVFPSSIKRPSETDIPLTPTTEKICEMAFNQLRPSTLEYYLQLVPWREVWQCRKDKFFTTGNLHQNNYFDTVHLSVKYKPTIGPVVHFHIYGYMKNIFVITHITILYPDGPKTLCSFASSKFEFNMDDSTPSQAKPSPVNAKVF